MKYDLNAYFEDISTLKLDTKSYHRLVLSDWVGRDVFITIYANKKRSNDQNALYWGLVVQQIIKWHKGNTGELLTDKEVHNYILQNVIGVEPQLRSILGQELWVLDYPSTSSMRTVEFNEFITRICVHFQERGLYIILPNE